MALQDQEGQTSPWQPTVPCPEGWLVGQQRSGQALGSGRVGEFKHEATEEAEWAVGMGGSPPFTAARGG